MTGPHPSATTTAHTEYDARRLALIASRRSSSNIRRLRQAAAGRPRREDRSVTSRLLAARPSGGASMQRMRWPGRARPTIVLVDISRTGWSWMRGPQAMIPALQKILPSTPFAGLGVFTTSLDSPKPMQTHLAITSTVQPETTTLIDQAARALNFTADSA